MNYVFQFDSLVEYWPRFLHGAWLTIELSAVSMAIGMALAVLLAFLRRLPIPALRFLIAAYIEVIRNTPFLVQIFLIFFGLPALGLRLSPDVATIVAMVVNVAAYTAEIIRAGIESIDNGQIEAGRALGLRPVQIFRRIILRPALRAVYPALTSQFLLLMLGSSIASTISADELTSVANNIQSTTFSSLEVYVVATAIYFAISMGFSAAFRAIQHRFFSYPIKR